MQGLFSHSALHTHYALVSVSGSQIFWSNTPCHLYLLPTLMLMNSFANNGRIEQSSDCLPCLLILLNQLTCRWFREGESSENTCEKLSVPCHEVCRIVGGPAFQGPQSKESSDNVWMAGGHTTDAKMQKPVRVSKAQKVMGKQDNGRHPGGRAVIPWQSCRRQDPRMGAELALEGPGGRRGPGMQRLGVVLRMADRDPHKGCPKRKIGRLWNQDLTGRRRRNLGSSY